MADILNKQFLDFEGLSVYDELIKAYIDSMNAADQSSVDEVVTALAQYKETNDAAVQANADAIAVLNGTAEGSVSKQVSDAIAALVDSAPETFDTLKEIADWIANDETGTTALLERVDEAEDNIVALKAADEDLKAYSDAQDEAYYNAIQSISEVKIAYLFPENQAADQTAAEAIAALDEGKALKLTAGQTVAENIVIDKDCYIDANGAVFTGEVSVPADAEVVIENAVFSNPVKVV